MGHLSPHVSERSSAHDLQPILRTTLSLLKHHARSIAEDRSLRNLELALICAIADLERVKLHRQERAVRGGSEILL